MPLSHNFSSLLGWSPILSESGIIGGEEKWKINQQVLKQI